MVEWRQFHKSLESGISVGLYCIDNNSQLGSDCYTWCNNGAICSLFSLTHLCFGHILKLTKKSICLFNCRCFRALTMATTRFELKNLVVKRF